MIYLCRHGETDWNREGRYQGRLESRLTELGEAQARALADALERETVARVITSPLRRCVGTAQPFAERRGLAIETDPDLTEIAHGVWEGRLRSEIERDDSETMRAWRAHPQTVHFEGGESLAGVAARWRAFTHRIGDADDLLIVTHDVVVRIAILAAAGRPPAELWQPRVVNAGYALFRDAASWELLRECVDDHLGALRVDTTTQAL